MDESSLLLSGKSTKNSFNTKLNIQYHIISIIDKHDMTTLNKCGMFLSFTRCL